MTISSWRKCYLTHMLVKKNIYKSNIHLKVIIMFFLFKFLKLEKQWKSISEFMIKQRKVILFATILSASLAVLRHLQILHASTDLHVGFSVFFFFVFSNSILDSIAFQSNLPVQPYTQCGVVYSNDIYIQCWEIWLI